MSKRPPGPDKKKPSGYEFKKKRLLKEQAHEKQRGSFLKFITGAAAAAAAAGRARRESLGR